MKKDIEHVVTSTAMFVIAFILSTEPEKAAVAPHRRRLRAPNLIWFVGIALMLGALVWTTSVYLDHVAFCAHLRLQGPAVPLIRSGTPPPPPLEYLDLSALGIEAVLLTALVFFGIRALRRRRLSR